MGETQLIAEPGIPQVVMIREFDAPPELLFRAYTEPELIQQWLGPRRLDVEVEQLDVRHGGQWRYIHSDADGSYPFRGVFHGTPSVEDGIVQTWEYEGAPGHVHLEVASSRRPTAARGSCSPPSTRRSRAATRRWRPAWRAAPASRSSASTSWSGRCSPPERASGTLPPSARRTTRSAAPARGAARCCLTRSSSARARTAWRRRSPWPAPVARCGSSRRRRRRGRVALGGADPPRLRPRHLLRRPPAPAGLAVPAQPAAGRARARARPPRAPARTPARRRHRGGVRALDRRDRRVDRRRRRRGLPQAGRPAGARRREAPAGDPRPAAADAPPARAVALRAARHALGQGPRAPLRRAARAGADRRARGALDAAARPAPDLGGRAGADAHRPPRRLAGRARRVAGGGRRARLARARARRRRSSPGAASSASRSSTTPAPSCST